MWLEKKKKTIHLHHQSYILLALVLVLQVIYHHYNKTTKHQFRMLLWSFIIKGITNKCRWNSNYKLKQIFISIKGHADVSLIKWAAYIHEMSKLKLKKMILYQYIKGNTTAWVWSHHLVLEFCPNLLHFSAWQNNCRSLAGCTVEIWN